MDFCDACVGFFIPAFRDSVTAPAARVFLLGRLGPWRWDLYAVPKRRLQIYVRCARTRKSEYFNYTAAKVLLVSSSLCLLHQSWWFRTAGPQSISGGMSSDSSHILSVTNCGNISSFLCAVGRTSERLNGICSSLDFLDRTVLYRVCFSYSSSTDVLY